MVMLRPKGKPQEIAEKVMRKKNIKISKTRNQKTEYSQIPYLQH